MRAKTYIAYYKDSALAKRVAHELFDVGVQRDAMSIIEGQIPDEVLHQPSITLPQDVRDRFQSNLDQGGTLIVAWVMASWKKAALEVFDVHLPDDFGELRGKRFSGLYTRT